MNEQLFTEKSRKHMKKPCNAGPTNTFVVSSPIGELTLTSCPRGLHSIFQMDTTNDSPQSLEEVHLLNQQWRDNGYSYKPALQCVQWLAEYFTDPLNVKALAPPICCSVISEKGRYQEQVWQSLQSHVGAGHTISYSALAALSSNARAHRAVGSAMRNNPLQILVPCHRVIRSDGSLGHYAGGTRDKVKAWLLKHEGIITT